MNAPVASRKVWLAPDLSRAPLTDAELAELEAIELAEREVRVSELAWFVGHIVFPVLTWLALIGLCVVAIAQCSRGVLP